MYLMNLIKQNRIHSLISYELRQTEVAVHFIFWENKLKRIISDVAQNYSVHVLAKCFSYHVMLKDNELLPAICHIIKDSHEVTGVTKRDQEAWNSTSL